MRILAVLVMVLAGIAAGIGLTAYAVGPAGRVFARIAGVWEFSPAVGATSVDPFTRARLFAEGELPLAAGEGYALRARLDDTGASLDGRCTYRLSSPFPAARYWTATLTDSAGRPVPNLAGRHGFTSAEIVREANGTFSIEIAPAPLAGNWLPGGMGAIEIILRFYETPLSATATQLDPRTLPALTRISCP
jgi:hypothetical protein